MKATMRRKMSIRVCIVEDDAGLRESISSFIDDTAGFECLGAFRTGEEAVVGIPTLQPAVVLMDINLPGMNGIECVRQLKEIRPELQVMMLTVYENSDRIFEALAAGACGYLLKNTPPEKLLEAIEDVRNGGSPMSSHIARKVVLAFQPVARIRPLIEHLAPREQQVLELVLAGKLNKVIADELQVSMRTVEVHRANLFEKMGVRTAVELAQLLAGKR